MTAENENPKPVALQNNPALDRMVRRFKDAGVERHEVDLEDGGPPLVFYSTPMTMKDKATLFKNMDKDQGEAFVETILAKALDADGNRLFTPDSKRFLLNSVDPDTITLIFSKVNRRVPSIEDLAGNSEATRTDSAS